MSKKQKKPENIKNILLWVLSVFCILAAFTYMPSFASILFLLTGIGSLPIDATKRLWQKIPVKGKWVKILAVTVMFFSACSAAPATSTPTPETAVVVEAEESQSEKLSTEVQEDVSSNEIVSGSSEEEPTESVTEALIATNETKAEKTEIGNNETDTAAKTETTQNKADGQAFHAPEGFDVNSVPAYSGKAYFAVNNNIPFFTDDETLATSYEKYSSLDEKGRCGVCVASIGTDIMPMEERGEIGNVKPSGWNQVKYPGIVEGNYLYNRCHLIGYQLAGENDNVQNLITGTRWMNTEGMLPFENMVADYVKETENHVMYRVTPIFKGNDLLASGVLMEAKSVEDNGSGILFCVYCYNVQPGVTIDYSNGASSLAEPAEIKTESNTTKSSDTNTAVALNSTSDISSPSQAPEPEVAPTSENNFAVNTKNGKIHMVGACPATGTGENAMTEPVYFGTYEEAEAYSIQTAPNQKKRQCGNCW